MRQDKIMIRTKAAEKELFDRAAAAHGLKTASWARSELLRVTTYCLGSTTQNGTSRLRVQLAVAASSST